ncbi:MAG: HPr family phosphocarrier protein [Lentisphaeria bacterium]|nr:HPr family phosphocarrier protein [Lentisphaeria bacterium]
MKSSTATVTVENRLGLHARPASMLVQKANTFRSEIRIIRDGNEVNCKSLLELLTLAAGNGTMLQVIASGEDADSAIHSITGLFSDKFGEE